MYLYASRSIENILLLDYRILVTDSLGLLTKFDYFIKNFILVFIFALHVYYTKCSNEHLYILPSKMFSIQLSVAFMIR